MANSAYGMWGMGLGPDREGGGGWIGYSMTMLYEAAGFLQLKA